MRKHLFSKQYVANLKRKVSEQTMIRHQDDATSVKMIVNELRMEVYDPLLLYKAQHVKDSQYPILPNDAFMLAIQSEWQKGNFPVQFCAPTLPMLNLSPVLFQTNMGKVTQMCLNCFCAFFGMVLSLHQILLHLN